MLKVIDIIDIGEETKMDRVGRVTIPATYRKKFGMLEGERVAIVPTSEGIFLKKEKDIQKTTSMIVEQEVERVVKSYLEEYEQEKEVEQNG